MKPKVFTRDNPCTKVHLHNCFYRGGKYVPRPVVEAEAEIGVNSPKYLIDKEYCREYLSGGIDWYRLTAAGEEWLSTGLQRFLVLHPDKLVDCNELPRGYSAPAKAPVKRILRRSS